MAGPQIGYGVTLRWDGDLVGELTRIGAYNITIAKQDSTNLAPTSATKTILPGLIDPGDLEIAGWFKPSDPGQAGMRADMLTRTMHEFIITFPSALSSATLTGNAYVTALSVDEVTAEGIVPFTAMLSITGLPTFGVTATTGPTDILITGNAGVVGEVPTYAAGVYDYTVDTSADATFNVKVTAAGADDIKMNINGGADIALTHNVASGEQATTSGEITTVVITVSEDDKAPKIYTFRCSGGV